MFLHKISIPRQDFCSAKMTNEGGIWDNNDDSNMHNIAQSLPCGVIG